MLAPLATLTRLATLDAAGKPRVAVERKRVITGSTHAVAKTRRALLVDSRETWLILAMQNVFVIYMPPGNPEAMVHYADTVKTKVPLHRMRTFISNELRGRLTSVFGANPIAVWGSRAGERNLNSFDRMRPGDDVLIVEGETVRFIGKIAAKTRDRALANELWKPLRGDRTDAWELVYFIANPREITVPFSEVGALFGYKANFQLRGFTPISEAKLQAFYETYDDFYSIVMRLQAGQPVERKQIPVADSSPVDTSTESGMGAGQLDVGDPAQVSDHVKMQWTLARLGVKAGERIWVPVGDQSKLRKQYEFDEFDEEFQAGIDLPHSYMENIDVVWKQEYRIGAAYEIENSTSIYSGLLRFADLNILAPNTLYPMFIVAPESRKNRLREQLRRPAFKRLELDKKVRFLSYETVDQIDEFFEDKASGLTVDVIFGKSELVA